MFPIGWYVAEGHVLGGWGVDARRRPSRAEGAPAAVGARWVIRPAGRVIRAAGPVRGVYWPSRWR